MVDDNANSAINETVTIQRNTVQGLIGAPSDHAEFINRTPDVILNSSNGDIMIITLTETGIPSVKVSTNTSISTVTNETGY